MSDPRLALEAIGQLPDTEIDIADAALQLARIDAPEADWESARRHLSDIARAAVDVAASLDSDNLADRAMALSGLLGGRYGYAGDADTYDDLANANLIRVIERRRGLPVALESCGCTRRARPDGAGMAWTFRRISWSRWKAARARSCWMCSTGAHP